MNRLYVGGVIAITLLGLYAYALIIALNAARVCSGTCQLSEGVAFLLQTLGALVSAVVVSELAVTRPFEAPGSRIAAGLSAKEGNAVKILAFAYILIWLLSGVYLIVMGWLQHPTVPQIVSAAKEWLGYAIAAGYAYFGISA